MKKKRKLKHFLVDKGDKLIARKTNRNSPCRCGSGLKSKNCCGCETTYLKKANKVIKKFNSSMGVCTGKTESGLKKILETL
ncbi:MAG: SEC-C metal-binding domain-containing protein [Candidatus Margulisbacteria bacterium]|nr:SEC-C metal-binding domain-containing protein [Candidatus Margulisiibacteriota bacterium]